MKTNKYKGIVLLAITLIVILGVNSCNDSDFLKETPKDFLDPETAYNTENGIRMGINGLHYSYRYDWLEADAHQDACSIYRGLGTDVAFHGEDPNSVRFLCNYETYLNPSSEYVRYYWQCPYRMIQRANTLLYYIDESSDEIWTSTEKRNAYRGEVLFFRAFCYKHLVSFFGSVPLVTEMLTEAKTDFTRAPLTDLYQLMEDDLTFATQHLPSRGQEEESGRITKAAAYHLLTEIYLMQQKYDEAINASSTVINDLGYKLMTSRFGSTVDVFGTGDVYLDLFAYGNQNLLENTETIWAAQFEPPSVTGGSNTSGGRAFGPAYFRMGNTPDGYTAFRGVMVNGEYTGYCDTLGRGVSWLRPTYLTTHIIWGNDWDNDIRNARHNIKRDFYFDNPESAYHGQLIDFSLYPASAGRDPIRDTCQYIYPFFLKFHDPMNILANEVTSGNGFGYKDWYVMRLAETYLLRAEAYIQKGQLDLAAADINMVRERSNAKPVSTANVDIDYLLDERIRELYGEECRHFVLRRTGKLLERVRRYNNNPLNAGLNIQDYNILWPIPQEEIDLNIDHKLEQNPGY